MFANIYHIIGDSHTIVPTDSNNVVLPGTPYSRGDRVLCRRDEARIYGIRWTEAEFKKGILGGWPKEIKPGEHVCLAEIVSRHRNYQGEYTERGPVVVQVEYAERARVDSVIFLYNADTKAHHDAMAPIYAQHFEDKQHNANILGITGQGHLIEEKFRHLDYRLSLLLELNPRPDFEQYFETYYPQTGA